MTDQEKGVMEDTETVTVEPVEGNDDVITDPSQVDDDPSSSPEEEESKGESNDDEPDTDDDKEVEEEEEKLEKVDDTEEEEVKEDEEEPAPVEGESPRERALRKEVQRLKGLRRDERSKDLLGDEDAPAVKSAEPELSEEEKVLLEKFGEEEVGNLNKVLGILAKKQGLVRREDLVKENYADSASAELNDFLEDHPEYLPENDKDNVLWGEFKAEYALYKRPENPRQYKKLFDRIHKGIVGPVSSNGKKVAAKLEKVKVASKTATSSPTKVAPVINRRASSVDVSSLGDHLKGFTDEEKAELLGE